MIYRKKVVEVEVEGPITEERIIKTLEGDMKASVGDYIVTGIKGERYPVKPDIFHELYEPVDVSLLDLDVDDETYVKLKHEPPTPPRPVEDPNEEAK